MARLAHLAHLAQLAQLAQLAVLVLLVVGAPRVAGAAEPLENESEPGKAGAAGKPWKGEPDLEELDLGTAGKGAAWTSWFNIDHPGGDGDHESLAAIRFYFGERVCARAAGAGGAEHGLGAAGGAGTDDVYWSHWSAWSPCSRSACGSRGVQSRSRRCRSARARSRLKELRCRGKATERRACSAGPCPEKPHMVLHPADRVREAGQDVTFCCEASGTPAPQNYSW
ncbi:hypothetical protein DUI87_33777 [Hirundo rustica rustica]|uniref:Ig-like domain-containing protein n=1 Tax=Hirundo rustica rustica TaxID=333673 RepID=A0A3M0IN25_HIRRU|nr:hypothetical protein DUI87_33777 [Hirundo rustica rustica]